VAATTSEKILTPLPDTAEAKTNVIFLRKFTSHFSVLFQALSTQVAL